MQTFLKLLIFIINVSYLGFAAFLIYSAQPDKSFLTLDLNEKGDFLAGIAAPLAFFWIILGYFQNKNAISIQSKELVNSIEAMNAANEYSKEQTDIIKSNAEYVRRDVFMKYAEFAQTGLHYSLIKMAKSLYDTHDNIARADKGTLIDMILTKSSQEKDLITFNPRDSRSLDKFNDAKFQFTKTYEDLTEQAGLVDDEDDSLKNLFYSSIDGEFYHKLKGSLVELKAEPPIPYDQLYPR